MIIDEDKMMEGIKMKLNYRDKKHKEAFKALLEQAKFKEEQLWQLSDEERRQFAFLYLLALYQKEYLQYEGEAFYIEDMGELELGGPTYLFDLEEVEMNRPHERMILAAKRLLQKQNAKYIVAIEDRAWVDEAICLVHRKE